MGKSKPLMERNPFAVGGAMHLELAAPAAGTQRVKGAELREVPLEALEDNPEQPRQTFDQGALEDLAASIRTHGILEPLLVEETAAPGRYRLVAGHRRKMAAAIAGLRSVPCILREEGEAGERLEQALVENLQREDLSAIEEADALGRLKALRGYSQRALAQAVGRSPAAVSEALAFFRLPTEAQTRLRSDSERPSKQRILSLLEETGREIKQPSAGRGGARAGAGRQPGGLWRHEGVSVRLARPGVRLREVLAALDSARAEVRRKLKAGGHG